jgi:hypothetical protein
MSSAAACHSGGILSCEPFKIQPFYLAEADVFVKVRKRHRERSQESRISKHLQDTSRRLP